jgi:ATP-dependent Clp protease ATP-binding subunit ClpC
MTSTKEAAKTEETNDVIDKELKKKFAPEFLNRIDGVVMFNSLSKDDINKIIDIEMATLVSRVNLMEFELEVSKAASEYIAEKGFDPDFGARPLKRAIQKYVEDVLTEEIIQSNPEKGSKLILDYKADEDKMIVTVKKKRGRKKDSE